MGRGFKLLQLALHPHTWPGKCLGRPPGAMFLYPRDQAFNLNPDSPIPPTNDFHWLLGSEISNTKRPSVSDCDVGKHLPMIDELQVTSHEQVDTRGPPAVPLYIGDTRVARHCGRNTTLATIAKNHFWHLMSKEVNLITARCIGCLSTRGETRAEAIPPWGS